MSRRRYNKILTLQDSNGDWQTDQTLLSQMATSFFSQLYMAEGNEPPKYNVSGLFPNLDNTSKAMLGALHQIVLARIKGCTRTATVASPNFDCSERSGFDQRDRSTILALALGSWAGWTSLISRFILFNLPSSGTYISRSTLVTQKTGFSNPYKTQSILENVNYKALLATSWQTTLYVCSLTYPCTRSNILMKF